MERPTSKHCVITSSLELFCSNEEGMEWNGMFPLPIKNGMEWSPHFMYASGMANYAGITQEQIVQEGQIQELKMKGQLISQLHNLRNKVSY